MEEQNELFNIDNKDYIVVNKLEHNNALYYLLGNMNDEKDIMILKEENDDLVTLDTEQEFDEVFKKFTTDNIF